MKHFRLCKKVDAAPFKQELAEFEGGWDDHRAKVIRVHQDTLAVDLRVGIREEGQEYYDAQKSRKTEHYIRFPQLTGFLEDFAREVNGELSRMMIVALKPDKQVFKHIDEGSYYAVRDRYHLVLQSPAGSRMVSGDEECVWHEGELWWFDNKAEHEAFNTSGGVERIHVIFDLKPKNITG